MKFAGRLLLMLLLLGGGIVLHPAQAAKPADGAAVLLRACSASHRAIVTKGVVEEADPVALRAEHAAEIDSVSTFKTVGLDRAAADEYLVTADGQELLKDLSSADPTTDKDKIQARAEDQLSTGSDDPALRKGRAILVKIVPHGQAVSPYSPFFATVAALEAACESPISLADSFALPVKSEAATYDLYEIKPGTGAPDSFVSVVAPTSELDGLVLRPGGARQSLVPNRGRMVGADPDRDDRPLTSALVYRR
ncbi:MAG: hypothetical protein WDN69_09135 [Aliidongia sp.]